MKKSVLALILTLALGVCGFAQADKAATATEAPTESATESAATPVDGGWMLNALPDIKLPDDAQAAFDKALDGFVGSNIRPVAYLGSQVVAGTNYCILCEVTPVVPDAVSNYALVYIYADLSGAAKITNIYDVDLGALSTATTADSASAVG